MHTEAYTWVKEHAPSNATTVLDLGGRDVNGTVRDLFPVAEVYTVLDAMPGHNVDIVADASVWTPQRSYDVVVCCEVFEHTPVWREICTTAYLALTPGGTFIATMGGPGRAPHSAVDGGHILQPGEHYGNVDPDDLHRQLTVIGFEGITVDQQHHPMADVRAVATRPLSKATGGQIRPANTDGDSITARLSDGCWYAPGVPDEIARELNQ